MGSLKSNLPVKRFLAYLFAVVLMAGMILFPYEAFRVERIRAMGEKETRGVVIGVFQGAKGRAEGPAENAENLYTVEYEYRDSSGIARVGEAYIDESLGKVLQRHDPLTVIYARSRPDVSRIEGQIEEPAVLFFARFSRSVPE